MFSCKNIFIRFYSYLNSDILVNPCKILLNGSFISEEIIVKVQTHENLLIECLLNDIWFSATKSDKYIFAREHMGQDCSEVCKTFEVYSIQHYVINFVGELRQVEML
jgi:hypothetical protein